LVHAFQRPLGEQQPGACGHVRRHCLPVRVYAGASLMTTKAVRSLMPLLAAIAFVSSSSLVLVQSTPPAQQGQGGGADLGRGATPMAYDDYTGFTKLWDGQTLRGWDGESDVWSIDNNAIHADTRKTPGQHHLHYVGPGAVMRDFDLKVE